MLKKKCFALVLCIALLVTANLPVLARGNYRCDACGIGQVTVQSSTVIQGWEEDQEVYCTKTMGLDMRYYRLREEVEKCDNCGVTYTVVYRDTKVVCPH